MLVHPDDLELVARVDRRDPRELGGIEHCEVQAERRVGRGGAMVRTPEGEIDARLETKLARAREVVEARAGRRVMVATALDARRPTRCATPTCTAATAAFAT